jgi:hypothetical protein
LTRKNSQEYFQKIGTSIRYIEVNSIVKATEAKAVIALAPWMSYPENTKGGSIAVPLISSLTGLDYSFLQIEN